MRLASSLLILGCGVFFGIALVLSCGSDNGPKPADAADPPVCNCAAAEPPVPPRVMDVHSDAVVPKATDRVHLGMPCPSVPKQSIALSGGCTIDYPSQIQGNVILEESAPSETGWRCTWSNLSNVDVPVHVVVRCLVPQ